MSRPVVYFGGNRHLGNLPIVPAVVRAVIQSGCSVHVGCQYGADQKIMQSASFAPSFLVVFAVEALTQAPAHVQAAAHAGAQVIPQAGGTKAPVEVRYLLRSIAAMRGCSQAVFFQPGPGSLACAREAIKQGIPVFCFNPTASATPFPPGPIPSTPGQWVQVDSKSYYSAFPLPCWQFQPGQSQLF